MTNDETDRDDDAGLIDRARDTVETIVGKNYRRLALDTLVELLDSEDDKIRLQAAQTLLQQQQEPNRPADKLLGKIRNKLT